MKALQQLSGSASTVRERNTGNAWGPQEPLTLLEAGHPGRLPEEVMPELGREG